MALLMWFLDASYLSSSLTSSWRVRKVACKLFLDFGSQRIRITSSSVAYVSQLAFAVNVRYGRSGQFEMYPQAALGDSFVSGISSHLHLML